METAVVVALVAATASVVVALFSSWVSFTSSSQSNRNQREIELLKIDADKAKAAAQRAKEISAYSEPLARADYDLQSRIYNIVQNRFAEIYLNKSERDRVYAIENTVLLSAQYMCWTELTRRDIQFIDLGEAGQTRSLVKLQDELFRLWATDKWPPPFLLFAGEQRAIGESLILPNAQTGVCMGYASFLRAFSPGSDPLLDALRTDIASFGHGVGPARDRLVAIQHALIDLLQLLDPDAIRFPVENRSKL